MTQIEIKPAPKMDYPTEDVTRSPRDPRKGGPLDDSGGFRLTLGDLLKKSKDKK